MTHEFLRKYIELVRCGGLAAVEDGDLPQQQQQQEGPRLSESAAAALADFYTTIRQRAVQQREEGAAATNNLLQPVTVRTLEASVRLAAAHAKLRLRRWITTVSCCCCC